MNLHLGTQISIPDYAWLSFKSYVEDNYIGKSHIEWDFPIQHSNYKSIEDFADDIVSKKPDIFSMSLYVWNVGISHEIAKLVKKKLPACIIVIGGPHIDYVEDKDYFIKNEHVDFVCDTNGYGEPFFNELLYQIETDKDWDKVPFLIKPNADRKTFKRSKAHFNKLKFEWPRHIFSRNSEYIKTLDPDLEFYIAYESSRGCPYGCTYCEWGGGINSKVSFKPTEYVLEDMDYIFKTIKPQTFTFTDANFGIIKRDIDIIRKICDYKEQIDLPRNVYFFGPTKSKKENLYEIEELLALYKLSDNFKVSIQDFDPSVIRNIDRTDDPWQKSIQEYNKIRNRYDVTVRAEMMLGLPGATLDNFYKGLDILCSEDIYSPRYVWHLLPTSPASKKEYREKFGIKTVKMITRHKIYGGGFSNIIDNKITYDNYPLIYGDEFTEPTELVCETNSYTIKEWKEMFIMNSMVNSFHVDEYMKDITRYLNTYRNVPYSTFYKKLYDEFIFSDYYLKGVQNSIFKKIKTDTENFVEFGKIIENNLEYYKLPEIFPWDISCRIENLINIAINLNRYEFYQYLANWIHDEFGVDEELADLLQWTPNMIKWIDYDIGNPPKIKSDYNWFHFKKTGELLKRKTICTPNDITYSSEKKLIDWHEVDINKRIEKYFLPLCSGIGSSKLFLDVDIEYVE